MVAERGGGIQDVTGLPKKTLDTSLSGSGLYDAYFGHLEFRQLANRSIPGFPN